MRVSKLWTTGAVVACLLAATAVAQEKSKEKVKSADAVVVERNAIVIGPHGPEGMPPPMIRTQGGGDNTFVFLSTEMAINGKVVRGAPYSAEAVTETTQALADGNRIVRKNTAQVYRDSEGRTRRDQAVGAVGPFASAGDPVQTVFINDPTSGVSYILDPRSRTARKAQMKFSFLREPKVEAEGKAQAELKAAESAGVHPRTSGGAYVFSAPVPPPPGGPAGDMIFYKHADGEEPKVEQLGTRDVEGVQAEGQRTTISIPAGAIGNEQAINIVTERWYSPELQTVVMTRHSDPRFGETVYRLTNINRSEPARTLFEVPSDYTLKEGGPASYNLRMKKREPGAAVSPEN